MFGVLANLRMKAINAVAMWRLDESSWQKIVARGAEDKDIGSFVRVAEASGMPRLTAICILAEAQSRQLVKLREAVTIAQDRADGLLRELKVLRALVIDAAKEPRWPVEMDDVGLEPGTTTVRTDLWGGRPLVHLHLNNTQGTAGALLTPQQARDQAQLLVAAAAAVEARDTQAVSEVP